MRILLLTMVLLGFPLFAQAVKVQILHTNDLHSYFEGTRTGKGGYARLKKLADHLKAQARAQGIKTIFLDGGDFGEGTSYFMSNNGVDAFKMLDALGIDVTVLGNHDYMQGGKVLAEQIDGAQLKTKILSANLKAKRESGLSNKIFDMVRIEVDGVKIGIFGLSTSEFHYQYPLVGSGMVLPPSGFVKPMEERAQMNKIDYLIALTHIGLSKDMAIVKKSKHIDLVVGGHSHTRLAEPRLASNKKGRQIPIVQTGANSMALGAIIVDIDPATGKNEMLSYQLHDIDHSMPEDETIHDLVEMAKIDRDAYFGRPFTEVIGESTFELSGSKDGHNNPQASCWGGHLAYMTLSSVRADVGLHIAAFDGEAIAAGPIRFGDMIDNFPHFREFGDGGWEIATLRINGLLLREILEVIVRKPGQFGINVAGVEPVRNASGKVTSLRINGKKFNPLKLYRLAIPSELPFALEKSLPWLRKFLYRNRVYTGVHYWDQLESYIRSNSPMTCEQMTKTAWF